MTETGSSQQVWEQCAICHGDVFEPVQYTCEGQHIFCFACVARAFESSRSPKVSCPMCRRSDGSVVVVDKLAARAGYVSPKDVDHWTSLREFRELRPLLEARFDKDFEAGWSLITAVQMFLYVKNIKTLRDLRNGRPGDRKWVSASGFLGSLGPGLTSSLFPMDTQTRHASTNFDWLFNGHSIIPPDRNNQETTENPSETSTPPSHGTVPDWFERATRDSRSDGTGSRAPDAEPGRGSGESV